MFVTGCKRHGAKSLIWVPMALLLTSASVRRTMALPPFAHRYGLSCSACHTMIPRLNPFGYQFLRNGFRIAGMKLAKPTLSDTMTFMTTISARDTNPGGDSGFNADGAEVQLATPIDNHLSTMVMYEFSSQTEAQSGFSEAWGQYNF